MSASPTKQTVARRANAAARRERVLADGGRALYSLLESDAAQALDKLERHRGESATAIISDLVIKAAKRL